VIDASSKDFDEKRETVRGVLAQLELGDKPMITVLNKIDQCDPELVQGLVASGAGVPICARKPATFGPLLEAMERQLWTQTPIRA